MGIVYQNKSLPEPYKIYIHDFNFDRYLEYANEDMNCELLNGILVIYSPPSLEHELIFKFLLNLLDLYSHEKNLGLVIGSRFTMKLSNKWAPEPDVMFVKKKKQKLLKDTYLDGPASVVFEILSPSTSEDDIGKKLPQYLKNGVEEVWIIDPIEKIVSIHSSEEFHNIAKDDWAVSKTIDGFKIKPKWLWNAQDVSIMEKFNAIK